MSKWLVVLTLVAACSASYAQAIDYTLIDPLVEMRAIWVNADAIPKTENGIRDLVRTYHRANINVLFPEVIARGYAAYPTQLLARDPRFEGAVDPLPTMIDEAHKLGMEVHPWVWVLRAGYTKDRGAILTAHPDWAMLDKYGEELSVNGGLWISPAISEARDFLAKLFGELVRKYDIDGLHLDYVRYEVQSPTPYGYSEIARREFNRQYAIDPVEIQRVSTDQILWNKFRERQINCFVHRIATQTRAIKPHVKISAAVGSNPVTARLNLMQNWSNWVANKWVDFVTPMTYIADDRKFARYVEDQIEISCGRTIVAPGIGLHVQKGKPEQTVSQIGITRELNAGGQALFASAYFNDALASALIEGPYRCPALVPFRDPLSKSELLACQAAKTDYCKGQAYFAEKATALAEYAKYLAQDTRYIPPTEPPLTIPAEVVPIPSVEIPKTVTAVIIDGRLDDMAWQSAAKVEIAYTNEGTPAPVRTTALLTYDNDYLYVAFIANEPDMNKIKAAVAKRDGPTFYDDSVELFIDPTEQRRIYYHLSTNTLGTRFDQRVFDASWNADWKSAAQTDADGFTVEMAVPLSAFGLSESAPGPGTKWALNLTRNRTTSGNVEYLTWAVPYGSFHNPDRFGVVVFGK